MISRSIGLMRRVGIEQEVTFTGGVTRNIGMVQGLNAALGFEVNVGDDSHFMGALGAALFARDHICASRVPAAHTEAPR
jgi:activator of 2-hydroxyglutaryl-CoA dehydratase